MSYQHGSGGHQLALFPPADHPDEALELDELRAEVENDVAGVLWLWSFRIAAANRAAARAAELERCRRRHPSSGRGEVEA